MLRTRTNIMLGVANFTLAAFNILMLFRGYQAGDIVGICISTFAFVLAMSAGVMSFVLAMLKDIMGERE